MYSTNEDLATYYAAIDLPSSIVKQFSSLIDKWVACNGIDWTVSRMKTIYTDMIRFRANQPLVGKWYKKNKAGLPSGVLSWIFKESLKKKSRFSCSTLLRSYTRYIRKEASEEQLTKFLTGVTAPDVDISSISERIADSCRDVGPIVSLINQPSFISYNPSPGKRVPGLDGKTYPEESHWQAQVHIIERTKTGRLMREKYPRIFSKVFECFNPMITFPHGSSMFQLEEDSVGKIGLIQEPGLKLRAVANPNRVYQIALKPLGDIIYDTISKLPWDCTFDQSKAIPVIQASLNSNKRVHCIDLTGATDYFPLSLQLKVLKDIFPGHIDYINLFEDLSRSPWFFKDTTIKWTKGQPLGLYPSFGSFALTHGLLLYCLNNNSFDNKFFVLGDDVVILDDSLALHYLDALKSLDCPVSLNKTISSSKVAEFGGKIIGCDYCDPQLKWRSLSDDNFIDIVKLLGRNSLRLLRPQQRKVVKAIWDIPDFLGGIGFNPHGIPLKDRYEKYLSIFGDDRGTFLTSYDKKHNQFFNEEVMSPSKLCYTNFWNSKDLPDLDQRSAMVCLNSIPSMVRWYGILGTNLYSVSLNKGVLPIGGEAKRSTKLAELQRKLRM